MGIRGRFLRAECAFLAATVMLTPLVLCACNENVEPTETETEITEPSATETVFVPTPFPSASQMALSDEEAEAEAIKLASRAGLEKDDLRGKYSLFLRYYKAVFTNNKAADFRAYLFSYFPLVADHIKPENEDFVLNKLSTLEMSEVETKSIAGGFSGNQIMFNKDMNEWGDYYKLVIYHESMHFIDAWIDEEVGEFFIMKDGTYKFYNYTDTASLNPDDISFHCSMGYFTEGGAEKYKTEYFTKASTDPTPTGLEFLVGLDYIFGKETVDEIYFSRDTALRFCNLLKENGFSEDEIKRILRTSVTDEVMTDGSKYIDPREVLIRLYKTKIGPDYENDAKFCRIIASLNKNLINKIPTEYRGFITKVTKSASKEAGSLKKAASKKIGGKSTIYYESDPYTIFLDGELKLVVMATIYKKDQPIYTSVVFDYDFENKKIKEINLYTDWKLEKFELNEEDFQYAKSFTADNSAAHNQIVRGTDPKLEEAYKKAEEIGNKYGVYFWFADLTPESIKYPTEAAAERDPKKISDTLDQIEEVLALYPEGYFDQLLFGGLYNGIGIHIYNCEFPDWSEPTFSIGINGLNYMLLNVATGFDYNKGGMIEKCFGEFAIRDRFRDSVTAIQARLICDIWTHTDTYIKTVNQYSMEPVVSEETWNANNYKDFQYAYTKIKYWDPNYVSKEDREKVVAFAVKNEVKIEYFLSLEAVDSPSTDRLLLYQYVMLSALTGETPMHLTPELKAKIEELGNGLRKVFDTSKWPEKTSWEKAI